MLPLSIAGTVTPALIALAGTLVGALIGAVTNLGLARSQRRDEARAGGRLVETDLMTALDFVHEWQEVYPDSPGGGTATGLQLEAWVESRGILAFSLDRAGWTRVRDGCAQVERLGRALEGSRKSPSESELESAGEAISAAAAALRRFDAPRWERPPPGT